MSTLFVGDSDIDTIGINKIEKKHTHGLIPQNKYMEVLHHCDE